MPRRLSPVSNERRSCPSTQPNSRFSPQSSAFSFFYVGRYLSQPRWQTGRMKFNQLAWFTRDEGETIAVFGGARLVKKLDGKIELLGGSAEDRAAAREWCSLFMHDVVFACASR